MKQNMLFLVRSWPCTTFLPPFQTPFMSFPLSNLLNDRQPLRTTAQERKTGLAVSDTVAIEEIYGGSKVDGVCELHKGTPVGRIIKELTSWQNLSPTQAFQGQTCTHCRCQTDHLQTY